MIRQVDTARGLAELHETTKDNKTWLRGQNGAGEEFWPLSTPTVDTARPHDEVAVLVICAPSIRV